MVVWLLVAAVVGYFLGSINPASIIAKARGIDLSQLGSGNPGATNAGRVMGRGTGIFVGAFDVLKGFMPVLLFSIFVGPSVG
ncbi:MAG: glycerol-3-phosphate acyltransferase, partial [Actinomycetes bacterium]